MSDRVVVHALPADLQVTDALSCFENDALCILLDSAARIRPRDARYTFLTADPIAVERIEEVGPEFRPFERLRQWQEVLPAVRRDDVPPFCGGIAGLMSYDLGAAFERLPASPIDEFRTPALLAGLFDWCLVWDHILGTVKCWILNLTGDHEVDSQRPTGDDRLQWVLSRLKTAAPEAHRPSFAAATRNQQPLRLDRETLQASGVQTGVYSDFSREDYLSAVDRVIEYIRAGDIFQANLSQRLVSEWQDSATELYRRVRHHNSAPFCAMLRADDFSVISSSPERFLKVDPTGIVETRPIKGTRRRQRSPIADLFTRDALVASDKDRAENVMIVDLLRNDISRVCLPGTVRVTGLCEIERFETVQHLVSTVEGRLRSECDLWDLVSACFPGGSITGAPKIRAMEIIAEIEPTVRGAYCGSMFYCGPNGNFDSSILIRTFTLKDGWLQFPVGGGIVADSSAEDEYRETLHKAAGMLNAITDPTAS